jgi:hypothetical protein
MLYYNGEFIPIPCEQFKCWNNRTATGTANRTITLHTNFEPPAKSSQYIMSFPNNACSDTTTIQYIMKKYNAKLNSNIISKAGTEPVSSFNESINKLLASDNNSLIYDDKRNAKYVTFPSNLTTLSQMSEFSKCELFNKNFVILLESQGIRATSVIPQPPTSSSLANTFTENNIIMLSSASDESIFDNKQFPAYFKYDPNTFIYEGMKIGNVECTSNSSANSISDFSDYSLYLNSDKKEWNILKKDNDIYTILAKNQCYSVYSGNKGSCNGNITKTNSNWDTIIHPKKIKMKFSYFCGKLKNSVQININFSPNSIINGTYNSVSKEYYLHIEGNTILSYNNNNNKWTINKQENNEPIATKDCKFRIKGCDDITKNYKDWSIENIELDLSILTKQKYVEIDKYFKENQTIYLHNPSSFLGKVNLSGNYGYLVFVYDTDLFYYKGTNVINGLNLYYYYAEKKWQICDNRQNKHDVIFTQECKSMRSAGYGNCSTDITKTNNGKWTSKQGENDTFVFNYSINPPVVKPKVLERVNGQLKSVGDSFNSSLSRFTRKQVPESEGTDKGEGEEDNVPKKKSFFSRFTSRFTRKNNSMRENTVPSQGQEDSNTQNSDGSTNNDTQNSDGSIPSANNDTQNSDGSIPSANNDTQKHVVHYVATVHRENQSTLTPKIKQKIDECIKDIRLDLSEREFVNKALCQLSKCDILGDTTADAANTEQTQTEGEGTSPEAERAQPDTEAEATTQTDADAKQTQTEGTQTDTEAALPISPQPETQTPTPQPETQTPTDTDATTQDVTPQTEAEKLGGGKRMYNKHKYNSRKKRKNKQKSHKKKYNVKYMSKRHSRRRHSRKRRCLNKQSGGIFGAAQYNETLYGSNAEQQQQHLLNGSLYPSAQGIQTAQTYQGGSRIRGGLRRGGGSKKRRGGSLGFIGANVVVPGALFAGNMIYGNSVKSQLYKRRNNRTYRHRR